MRQARVLTAEFLGTFALTFFGAGAICADALLRTTPAGVLPFGPADLLLVATAHAMALGVMVTGLGHISGAHFNPAVTFAAAMARKIEPVLAVLYVVTQLVGGLVAALLLRYVFPEAVTKVVNLGAPTLTPGFGVLHGVVIEAVLTFFLVTVVFATAIDPRGAFGKIAGFGIGFVLFFDILMGGPITGAAMNPARAFGPALLGGAMNLPHFALYWAGPLIGAVAAGALYEAVLIHEPEDVATDVPPPSKEAL
ncbi:MAG: aquaporin [Chloroflexota bacterium]|jgi:aquaporin Z|nr:aquaporin [Chloroflexota bacterium]